MALTAALALAAAGATTRTELDHALGLLGRTGDHVQLDGDQLVLVGHGLVGLDLDRHRLLGHDDHHARLVLGPLRLFGPDVEQLDGEHHLGFVMSARPASASFTAIGTTCTVCVTDPAALAEATDMVHGHVAALDAAASRFRPDSELSVVHASSGRPVRVSSLLFRAVEEALAAAEGTGGLVDPSVGRALQILGYDRDFAQVAPTGPATVRVAAVPGWRAVRTDRLAGTVTVPRHVELDLGATAKAGCADRAAAAVAVLTGSGVLVNLGGDIAVAGEPPAEGWVIRIADRHDADAGDPAVTVAIRSGGLATSGTAARRWERGGRQVHHIVDPATGAPAARYWRTVSVTAETCLAANTASTAAIILGADAPRWLAARGLHARLVTEDGAAVAVGDWPLEALVAVAPRPTEEARAS